MNRFRLLTVLLGGAALASCGKGGPVDLVATAPNARVKFFNFGVNAPGVNFYANDSVVTAIGSTACTPMPAPPADSTCRSQGVRATTGTTYSNAAAGGLYSSIAPGQYTLTGRIAATTDNGLTVASVSTTVAGGKAYSFYVSGIYSTTSKTVDAFVVEDNYPQTVSPDTTYLRFVNAISNAGTLTLYLRDPTTLAVAPVGTAQAYKGAGSFVAFYGGGAVDLVVRTAGATTNAITRTGLSFSPGRVYTITARGDITVTSSSATNAPSLDNTANY